MKIQNPTDQKRIVDDWNAKYPAGTSVIVTRDNGVELCTTTRSEAQLFPRGPHPFGGASAVIWVNGISGLYLLDRVRPA